MIGRQYTFYDADLNVYIDGEYIGNMKGPIDGLFYSVSLDSLTKGYHTIKFTGSYKYRSPATGSNRRTVNSIIKILVSGISNDVIFAITPYEITGGIFIWNSPSMRLKDPFGETRIIDSDGQFAILDVL